MSGIILVDPLVLLLRELKARKRGSLVVVFDDVNVEVANKGGSRIRECHSWVGREGNQC